MWSGGVYVVECGGKCGDRGVMVEGCGGGGGWRWRWRGLGVRGGGYGCGVWVWRSEGCGGGGGGMCGRVGGVEGTEAEG